MPEKSQKRKLRSDQSTSQFDIETASSVNDENTTLSERDFEDISNKIENRISKRLKDTELNQREILKLIENLSSKVDSLSSVNSEQGYSTTRTENSGNPTVELEETSLTRNEGSNSLNNYESFSQHIGNNFCFFHTSDLKVNLKKSCLDQYFSKAILTVLSQMNVRIFPTMK